MRGNVKRAHRFSARRLDCVECVSGCYPDIGAVIAHAMDTGDVRKRAVFVDDICCCSFHAPNPLLLVARCDYSSQWAAKLGVTWLTGNRAAASRLSGARDRDRLPGPCRLISDRRARAERSAGLPPPPARARNSTKASPLVSRASTIACASSVCGASTAMCRPVARHRNKAVLGRVDAGDVAQCLAQATHLDAQSRAMRFIGMFRTKRTREQRGARHITGKGFRRARGRGRSTPGAFRARSPCRIG